MTLKGIQKKTLIAVAILCTTKMKRLTKTFNAELEFKDGDETGEFKAIFASFGKPDRQGDIVTRETFQKQESSGKQIIIEGWNHNLKPVGKGTLHTNQNEAYVKGQFFLDTEGGQDMYRIVKNLGNTEWSYTFNVLEKEDVPIKGKTYRKFNDVEVYGVSPVTVGAAKHSRTVFVKELGDAENDNDDTEVVGETVNEDPKLSPEILEITLKIEEEDNEF